MHDRFKLSPLRIIGGVINVEASGAIAVIKSRAWEKSREH
jgi:hypothetical protein